MALVNYEQCSPTLGIITLNDPENLNAMGEEMATEFSALTAKLGKVTTLRSIILTGAGRAFSAGGRLEMLDKKRALSPEENRRRMLDFYHAFLSIRDIGVPTIAAINGHAVGAGLCLACGCDLRLAASGAKLGVTFVKLGLHPGMGATYFFPRILGEALAMELLLTGRVIEADEGAKTGLVAKVVSAETLMKEARALADEIATAGPAVTKQLLETLRGDPKALEAALVREADCQSINYGHPEFAEGVTAAIEKRKAKF